MPEKIIKTLWDESSDLESEIESTRPLLTDDYTSDDVNEIRKRIEGQNPEVNIKDDDTI